MGLNPLLTLFSRTRMILVYKYFGDKRMIDINVGDQVKTTKAPKCTGIFGGLVDQDQTIGVIILDKPKRNRLVACVPVENIKKSKPVEKGPVLTPIEVAVVGDYVESWWLTGKKIDGKNAAKVLGREEYTGKYQKLMSHILILTGREGEGRVRVTVERTKIDTTMPNLRQSTG